MRFLRGTVFTLGLAGALLFGGAWLTSLIAPQWVEQIGRELVRQEVERRVGEKLDVLDRSTLVGLARRLGGEQAQRAERAARQLRDQLPAKVAEVTAHMRQLDCECRRQIERRLEEAFAQTRRACSPPTASPKSPWWARPGATTRRSSDAACTQKKWNLKYAN